MARTARSSRPDGTETEAVTHDLEVSDPELVLRLTGPNGEHLRAFEKAYGIAAGLRGNSVLLRGTAAKVEEAERGLAQVVAMLEARPDMSARDVLRAVQNLRDDPTARLEEYMSEPVLVSPRKTITPKGVRQHAYVKAIHDHDVVFGIGPAGTGKTYLAMAMAVRALTENRVKRIVLTRPAVEAGEKLGFLPGDLAEKVNPYLRPLYDALHDMMDLERVQLLMTRGAIEVAPLAFMRGRTLNDSFVILDEAQNSTREQMKMFLTRLGFGSKAVVTGDVTQTDLPPGKVSGLMEVQDVLQDVPGIRFCYFSREDVVRHPLVQEIIEAYESRALRPAPGEGRPA